MQILADVAELKATLASTEQKKAELEGQALKTTDQLKRAEQLIGGLGDERERWQESADRLAKDLKNLVGNVMLASGCLAYLGPFTRQAFAWVSPGVFRSNLSFLATLGDVIQANCMHP